MTDRQKILDEIKRLKKELYKQQDFRIDRSPIPVYDTNAIDGMLKVLDEVKEFINSLPTEQSEDLEKAANIYANKQGLELKPFARRFFKAGAQWQKEQDINKACEWLKENIYNRVYKCNDGLGFPTAAFLEEFKKAMEEQ